MSYMSAKALVHSKDLDLIMKKLLLFGLDTSTDGFWILNINTREERYSPKFIASLGYEGDHDFPPVMQSWMNAIETESLELAYSDFEKHVDSLGEHPYHITVTYNKKHGGKVQLICSGVVVDWDNEPIMLGTHEIIRTHD